MRFWWCCADSDYAYSYDKKMAEVGQKDILSYVSTYIEGKNPLVMVYVNPELFEEIKDTFTENGFEIVSDQNAFWFK